MSVWDGVVVSPLEKAYDPTLDETSSSVGTNSGMDYVDFSAAV